MASGFRLEQGISVGLHRTGLPKVNHGLDPLALPVGICGSPPHRKGCNAGASLGSLMWSGLGTTHFWWVYKPETLYVMGN